MMEMDAGPSLTLGGPGGGLGRGPTLSSPHQEATQTGLRSGREDDGHCPRCESRGLDHFGNPCSCAVGKRVVAALVASNRVVDNHVLSSPSPRLANFGDYYGVKLHGASSAEQQSLQCAPLSEPRTLAMLQQTLAPRVLAPPSEPAAIMSASFRDNGTAPRSLASPSEPAAMPARGSNSLTHSASSLIPAAACGATMDGVGPIFAPFECKPQGRGASHEFAAACTWCPHNLNGNASRQVAGASGCCTRGLGVPSVDALMDSVLGSSALGASVFDVSGDINTSMPGLSYFGTLPPATNCSLGHGGDLLYNSRSTSTAHLLGATSAVPHRQNSLPTPCSTVPWPPPPLPPVWLDAQRNAQCDLERRVEQLTSERAKVEAWAGKSKSLPQTRHGYERPLHRCMQIMPPY